MVAVVDTWITASVTIKRRQINPIKKLVSYHIILYYTILHLVVVFSSPAVTMLTILNWPKNCRNTNELTWLFKKQRERKREGENMWPQVKIHCFCVRPWSQRRVWEMLSFLINKAGNMKRQATQVWILRWYESVCSWVTEQSLPHILSRAFMQCNLCAVKESCVEKKKSAETVQWNFKSVISMLSKSTEVQV